MIQNFSKTTIQKKAIQLMISPAKFIMLYGGSRSGKSFIIVYAIIVRACKVKSRHVMLRQTFNSIKTSIWLDTMIKVLAIAFPDLTYKMNKTDYYLSLPNGSEVWICGLDDDKRVEKILGKEFSTIFFNECSQLSYNSVQVALTRLAEKNSLKKKVFFDENPPSKKHWSYWLFIKKIEPIDSEPLEEPDSYASMIMNPKDNMENIDEDYLKMLAKMPEKDRLRFLEGEFLDGSDGEAYYSFNRELHVADTGGVQPGTLFIGMDFNVHPFCGVIGQYMGGKFYIHDEMFLENSDTPKAIAWLKKHNYYGTVIPDSTGKNRKTSGKSDFIMLKEAGYQISSTLNPYVVDRVNNINRLLTDNRIIINPKCKKLIGDLEKVSWKDNKLDQKGEAKMLTHISDALGYMCWRLDKISAQGQRGATFS